MKRHAIASILGAGFLVFITIKDIFFDDPVSILEAMLCILIYIESTKKNQKL